MELGDFTKREWKEMYWEQGLKRSFNGADREYGLTPPVQVVMEQSLKSNVWPKENDSTKPSDEISSATSPEVHPSPFEKALSNRVSGPILLVCSMAQSTKLFSLCLNKSTKRNRE